MSGPAKPRIWREPTPTSFVPWPATVAELLHGAAEGIVMATGALPHRSINDVRALAQEVPPAGWRRVGDAYVNATSPRITWAHDSGRRVRFYRAAPWFGEDCPPDVAAAAYGAVRRRLRDYRTPVAPTPGTTGRYLLANLWRQSAERAAARPRSSRCDGPTSRREFPPVCPIIAAELHESARQGRVELYPAAEVGGAELHKWDGRTMYLGLARVAELPVGSPRRVDREEPGGDKVAAFYKVAFRCPRRWVGVGRVAVPGPLGRLRWPTEGEHVAWMDASELALLRAAEWDAWVVKGWVWPARYRALRGWAELLLAEIDHAENLRVEPELRRALRAAWRAMGLHAIGAMHGRPYRTLREAKRRDLVPADAVSRTPNDDGTWAYELATAPAFARQYPDLIHPEWTAHLWALCRYRLVEALDDVPARQLVAANFDAVYLAGRPDGWTDVGRAGRFRPVGEWGRWPALRSMKDLYRFTREHADEDENGDMVEAMA